MYRTANRSLPILAVVLLFISGCAGEAVRGAGRALPTAAPAAYCPHGTLANGTCAGDAATPSPTKFYATPVPEDFALTVNELSRKCFGSAGCNVTFSINLTNVGAHEFDPSKSYKIVYTINGTEDPYSNNLTITGDRYSYAEEEFAQVKNKSTKLTATITSIIPA